MKIAIIGSGISGLATAHYLAPEHEVTLFEAGWSLGGHTATIDIEHAGVEYAVDTGFIVYNDWTYPHFIELIDSLGVASQPTQMSFSVSDRHTGLEYSGSSLNTLFAQRRNLVSPRFLSMVRDILRFNSQAERHLAEYPVCSSMTLGEYLAWHGYSKAFRDYYLVPMGAAIWSAGTDAMLQFPLQFVVRFFRNHGLLNIRNRPQWRVIKGGSRSYIQPLIRRFENNIELGNPVRRVSRLENPRGETRIYVESRRFHGIYDRVVFACHSDQALALLEDASPREKTILGAIPYTRNEVVLHTDTSLLPRDRRCWSSWNVGLDGIHQEQSTLTYNMNILQGLSAPVTFCVTLNQTDAIHENAIKGVYHYDHPVFTEAGLQAQQRWHEINGVNSTWFCGAYWRNGFHEDGVWSARRVAQGIASKALQATSQLAQGAAA